MKRSRSCEPSARSRVTRLIDKLAAQGHNLAFLQYGFHFRKSSVREVVVNEPLEHVRERILEDLRHSGNPSLAVIEGVDDAWEVSILKFSFDMIMRSQDINTFDFKRHGLI